MKETLKIYKQFEVASDQLKQGDSIYTRLAFILIDNLVELLFHELCTMKIARVNFMGKYSDIQYSVSEKNRILGKYFDEKVKFVKKIGIITDLESDFILMCHKYRNELYHKGIVKEDVIMYIAKDYYELACKLYMKNGPSCYVVYSSRNTVAKEVASILGQSGIKFPSSGKENWESLFNVLLKNKVKLKKDKKLAIKSFLLSKLEEMEAMIFSVKDGLYGEGQTPEQYIKHILKRDFLWSNEGETFLIKHKPYQEMTVQQADAFLENNWKPKNKYSDIKKWSERSRKLIPEKSTLLFWKKFDKLISEIESLEEVIIENVSQFDAEVQHQIDYMRGK